MQENNKMIHRALKICIQAHQSQVDKGGTLYCLHPITISLKTGTTEEMIVALLHDVVEDSSWTMGDLKKEGFSEAVLAAVEALTRLDGEPYQIYIERVAGNSLATKVKMLDLQHNMEPARLSDRGPEDDLRTIKYMEAYTSLRRRIN